jgi:hypothetical protein
MLMNPVGATFAALFKYSSVAAFILQAHLENNFPADAMSRVYTR